MRLSRSTLLVGDGRLTGAVERNGRLHFFIDSDGIIIQNSMEVGRRGVANEGFESYADEYTETVNARISQFSGELQVEPL